MHRLISEMVNAFGQPGQRLSIILVRSSLNSVFEYFMFDYEGEAYNKLQCILFRSLHLFPVQCSICCIVVQNYN